MRYLCVAFLFPIKEDTLILAFHVSHYHSQTEALSLSFAFILVATLHQIKNVKILRSKFWLTVLRFLWSFHRKITTLMKRKITQAPRFKTENMQPSAELVSKIRAVKTCNKLWPCRRRASFCNILLCSQKSFQILWSISVWKGKHVIQVGLPKIFLNFIFKIYFLSQSFLVSREGWAITLPGW